MEDLRSNRGGFGSRIFGFLRVSTMQLLSAAAESEARHLKQGIACHGGRISETPPSGATLLLLN